MRNLVLLAPLLILACKGGNASGDEDSSTSTTSTTGGTTSPGTPGGTTSGTPGGTTTTTTGTPPPIAFTGPAPHNVLMISIDTTRKDHMGFYNPSLQLTPFLDSIANQGVIMDDHLQCSNWTMHGGTCTMHGREASEIGHMPRLSAPSTPVPEGNPTLATVLKDQGYWTILSSGNGYMSPNWGSATGYDVWAQITGGNSGEGVTQYGLDQIDAALASGDAANGWFLHLHFMEPHETYDPDPAYIVGLDLLDPWPRDLTAPGALLFERGLWPTMSADDQALLLDHLAVLYQAEIRQADARISEAWAELDSRGLLDDTLVVFWTDHGEQFFEHSYQSHAYELQYGENDGSLFFWAHDIVPGHYTEPTTAIDVVPTVLDLIGAPVPSEMTGLPIGTAPSDRIRYGAAIARAGVLQHVERDGFKLHYNWDDGELRYFDRNTDPLEATDLFDPYDANVVDLWCALEARAQAIDALIPETPTAPATLVCPPSTTTVP